MYRWEFTPQAFRDLKKLPLKIQKAIIQKLDYYVTSGTPLSFTHHLINAKIGQYRFRVGDYRIVFDLEEETIVVLAVGHRKEIYK